MGNKFCHNIKQWATSIWNLLDFLTFVLFFLGFGFSYYDKYASNIIFSTYLSVSWIRALQFFRRPKTLGVYLALIRMTVSSFHVKRAKVHFVFNEPFKKLSNDSSFKLYM